MFTLGVVLMVLLILINVASIVIGIRIIRGPEL
jgi:hypothetical protein